VKTSRITGGGGSNKKSKEIGERLEKEQKRDVTKNEGSRHSKRKKSEELKCRESSSLREAGNKNTKRGKLTIPWRKEGGGGKKISSGKILCRHRSLMGGCKSKQRLTKRIVVLVGGEL